MWVFWIKLIVALIGYGTKIKFSSKWENFNSFDKNKILSLKRIWKLSNFLKKMITKSYWVKIQKLVNFTSSMSVFLVNFWNISNIEFDNVGWWRAKLFLSDKKSLPCWKYKDLSIFFDIPLLECLIQILRSSITSIFNSLSISKLKSQEFEDKTFVYN